MKRISGGIINVSVKRSGDSIQIIIQDDGIGINSEKQKELLDNSLMNSGLRNVNKRLLNKYGQGLLIHSKEEEGTTVTANIPIK